jgi:integrase
MASLYKPTIVTYRLPDGSYRTPSGERVTKDTPGAVKEVSKSKKWYGRYTDGAGRQQRVPLSESKETARRMLAKLAGDAQLAGVGIEDRFAEHRARPAPDHLDDYRRHLTAKGDTAEYVAKTCYRAKAVLDGCACRTLDDIDATAVAEFIAGLRTKGRPRLPLDRDEYTRAELIALLGVHKDSVAPMLRAAGLDGTGNGSARRYSRETVAALQDRLCRGAGPATCNHYLHAVKGFTRWLAEARPPRLPFDPLAGLHGQNADVDVRRRRRALRPEAFARFIDATAAGKPFRGLTGADRLVLYTLAANTGFRAHELASLSPSSFALDARPPTVTVEAAYSKHRRKDVQPLRADVAKLMRGYTSGRPRKAPLWPGTWANRAARMLRTDLTAAGIPYRDEDGRVFDFHAMRGQFISMLAANGVHPKVAQILARHSTITLTMDFYTHLDVLDVAGALDKLPPVAGNVAAETEKISPRPKIFSHPAGVEIEGPDSDFEGKARARRSDVEAEAV